MSNQGLASQGCVIKTANLGYPRIGKNRELKKATESFWQGKLTQNELEAVAKGIRKAHWLEQKNAGIEIIPSNDFSFYDQMLDMICLLGVIPERYRFSTENIGLDTYFQMARGIQEKEGLKGQSVPAMEMTKWLDTNYHYIVPEFRKGETFRVLSRKVFDEFKEALDLGIQTRPVLIGPVTFLLFGKAKEEGFSTLSFLDTLLPVYVQILKELKSIGADWVQIDEPVLGLDLDPDAQKAIQQVYETIAKEVPDLHICLTTYFEALQDNLSMVSKLPVSALHVDLVRAAGQLKDVLTSVPSDKILSLGVVDGRNVWKTDLHSLLRHLRASLSSTQHKELWIAPSCSLIHTPLDLDQESKLDTELKSWLAFAKQKLAEINVIQKALLEGDASVATELKANLEAMESRRDSARTNVRAVRERCAAVNSRDLSRKSSIEKRREVQRKKLNLPLFPTTTIGSFPQTKEVRQNRRKYRNAELTKDAYEHFIQDQIKDTIQRQVEIDLDVFVHGEFERTDMVEYFGEQLEGFAFSQNGWVQSYGSRYVKPPLIYGDVSRPGPMTVAWYEFAQAQTKKPVKGMLTGPVTILQWSFVRDDQPRSETAKQIALAIRDEVVDLEKAGAPIVQIDEAAFREGLPLRKSQWKAYLKWAVEAFRLASSAVEDTTQIHTHMCYSEFNDIIEAIADMNADVISIETSRSQMELLDAFVKFKYPSDVGPGVYDIHSPRVPSAEEIDGLLQKAIRVLPTENLWVNPDCGLKTRGWEETMLSLKAMVETAKKLRLRYSKPAGSAAVK